MMFRHNATIFLLALLSAAFLPGCSKDDDPVASAPADRSRIGYVIEDNFNFTTCRALLELTQESGRLKSDTAYTFLAPDNDAFLILGMNTNNFQYANYSGAWFNDVARNLILPGAQKLRSMPLGDNQPLATSLGYKVYVSRYKAGNDTITRVNGAKVSVIDINAGNGLMQSVMEVIQPETKRDLVGLLMNDTSYTLFTQALQHSGLLPLLKTGEYTLLAPHNAILRSRGTIQPGINLSSSAAILAADPAVLAELLKYHILPGRYFLDGIHRAAIASGDASVTTLHGAKIIIGGNMDTYNSTTFRGQQNPGAAGIYRLTSERTNFANMPAGNGVLHGINQVLIP